MFNALTFISPTLPLPQQRPQRLISISTRSPVSLRLPPRAAANKSFNSLDQFSTYLLYTVTPLLLTNPLATLAQTAESTDSTTSIDPSQITQSDLDDSLLSRILGFTALVLLVIASVGAIFLSVNNFILSREDKKHRQWVQDRIDGKPSYPKNMWSPDVDTTFPKRGTNAEKGMNREARRMEKRVKDKEEREKKRKAKLAKQREAAKADKEQQNK